jgi:hypothetical protein
VGAARERRRGPVAWLRARWAATALIEDAIGESHGSRRLPLRALPLRLLGFFLFLVVSPFRAAMARRWQRRPGEQLKRHVRAVWRTSPSEAVALARAVHDKLMEAHRAGTLTMFKGRVEIAPYGRFNEVDRMSVELILYDSEFTLGNFEQALALVGPPTSSFSCLRRVDCLLGMFRREEAVDLLRASLHLDGPRGRIQAKLVELEGTARGGFN